eukprot:scaffold9114_cov118-Isochrysis_galbana.AAC.10
MTFCHDVSSPTLTINFRLISGSHSLRRLQYAGKQQLRATAQAVGGSVGAPGTGTGVGEGQGAAGCNGRPARVAACVCVERLVVTSLQ